MLQPQAIHIILRTIYSIDSLWHVCLTTYIVGLSAKDVGFNELSKSMGYAGLEVIRFLIISISQTILATLDLSIRRWRRSLLLLSGRARRLGRRTVSHWSIFWVFALADSWLLIHITGFGKVVDDFDRWFHPCWVKVALSLPLPPWEARCSQLIQFLLVIQAAQSLH